MEIVILSIVAFLTALLTFFSGYGLGTLLAPVLMLFFPVDVAIALTGIVHFFNNMFKLVLVGKNVNKEVFIRFGIPAIIFAFIGAYVLLQIPTMQPLFSYELLGKTFSVYPLKLTIAILILFFAMMDILPYFNIAFGHFKGEHCVLEQRLSIDYEVSVVLASDEQGRVACFPTSENQHTKGILDVSIVPARATDCVRSDAEDVAVRIAERARLHRHYGCRVRHQPRPVDRQ